MSDDLQIGVSSVDSTNLKRIRSAHRRRLLDRLTDGGATVSILCLIYTSDAADDMQGRSRWGPDH